jgi:hypothetical protein
MPLTPTSTNDGIVLTDLSVAITGKDFWISSTNESVGLYP